MLRHAVVLLIMVLAALSACAPKRVLRQPGPADTQPVRKQMAPEPEIGRPRSARTPPRTIEPPREPAQELSLGVRAATLAREQVGKPYRWGGRSPERGFDCSGLVQWSYGCLGLELPRVVSEQRRAGRNVHGGSLLPGDLVFFAIDGGRISHVGVFLGDDRFVHAPRSGRPVRIDSLGDPYWRPRWTSTRRVVGT